jgi:hypothetical protein
VIVHVHDLLRDGGALFVRFRRENSVFGPVAPLTEPESACHCWLAQQCPLLQNGTV